MSRFLLFLALVFVCGTAFAADPVMDRTTPRRAFKGFRAACTAEDYETAVRFVDSHAIARNERDDVAESLCDIAARGLGEVNADALPDSEEAGQNDVLTVATLEVDEEKIPFNLSRVHGTEGFARWVVSRDTVAAIPELTALYGRHGIEEHMPAALKRPRVMAMAPWQWIGVALEIAIAIVLARILTWLILSLATRVTKKTANQLDDHLVSGARGPLRLLLAVFAFRIGAPFLSLGASAWGTIARALSTATVIGFAWLAIRLMHGGASWLEQRSSISEREYRSRGLRTQIAVLYRVASIVVFVIAVAAMLLQFEVVRSVGTSLLASAGIAGITIGLAAQKSLGAIIAGIQISIAQPVRIGDTVVVDTQQGVVEEIHLTYIVLRLADDRRLIAPVNKFLDSSFENWTKLGSELKGYVMIPGDFGTPIDAIRKELEVICKKSSHWDGRTCRLDVTDVTAQTALMLRATVSAKNSDELWELRNEVRESLVRFLVGLENGKHIPRARAQTVS
ncbi:MAG TPA: mechanosensitive ion channel domain-containing protein [Polyangiaceae bacterium]|jgi:small-conductance mechanosensitive channel|nr:mechanosensitive ion channel domain-containing protein [Polyangiaceae bacterium]